MSRNYDSYPSKKISETFSKINSICIVIFFFLIWGRNWHLWWVSPALLSVFPFILTVFSVSTEPVCVFCSQRQLGQHLMFQTNTETSKRTFVFCWWPCSVRSLTLGCLWEQGGTQHPSQKPSVCGCKELHISVRVCVCERVSVHVCVVCGVSIQLHNLPCSLNHIRFQAENNKTTVWQKSSAESNRPQGKWNTHTHTHTDTHTHTHTDTHTHTHTVWHWSVRLLHKQLLF